MENINAVIISNDLQYAETVCRCIRSIQSNINISSVKTKESINDYDFVLIDGKNIDIDNKPCCYIVEKNEKLNKDEIYKYSRASEYINRMIDIYYDATGNYIDNALNEKKPVINVFSSAKGGVGCTSIAFAMAKDYAMASNENILYLSLGNAHEEIGFFNMNQGLSIRDYLYRIIFLDDKCNINSYLTENQYGIRAFNMLNIENEILNLDEGDFLKFIRLIIENSQFRRIVIDTGSSLDDKAKYVRKIADYNIYIGCDFKSDFEENVKNSLGIDFGRKIIVENMRYKGNHKFDEFFEVENKLAENIDVGIYEEKEAFVLQNGKIDIEIDGEFGKGVRNLITFIANK